MRLITEPVSRLQIEMAGNAAERIKRAATIDWMSGWV